MLSFSQRKGLESVSELIQVGEMNIALRNSIWNVLYTCGFGHDDFLYGTGNRIAPMEKFSEILWAHFYKIPVDERGEYSSDRLEFIREDFFSRRWNKVYDFIQFVVSPQAGLSDSLSHAINHVLEREGAGYRIIDTIVVDITAEEEVKMLENAIRDTKFAGVSAHLKRALELMADRENPDYRNSIKESICAIESMAKVIVDDPKATLAEALKVLEKNGQMHKALKDGFLKLYGYTSDEEGIRHAMLEEPSLTISDAKYFLMSCTSFANYLKAQLPS